MATMITSECINCGACEPECPNTAIYQGGVEWELNGVKYPPLAEGIFYIVPEKCTECVGFYDQEACAAVCPVDCCVPDPQRVESEAELLARARALHPEVEFGAEFPSRFRKAGAAAVSEPPIVASPPPGNGAATAAPPAVTPPPPAVAKPAASEPKAKAAPTKAASAPKPTAPAKKVEEKLFHGELAGSFEQALARLRPKQCNALLGTVLAAAQPVLGALPDSTKRALEEAIRDRRFFHTATATGLNVLLNLLLYPTICLGVYATALGGEIFSQGGNKWIFLGLAVATGETLVRLRELFFHGVPPSQATLRGAFYGLLLAPLVAPFLSTAVRARPPEKGEIAVEGYYSPEFDDKTERARRYGEVYTVEEFGNAYVIRMELPRRVPVSAAKRELGIGDEMPDYDYDLSLNDGTFVIKGKLTDPQIRKLAAVSPAFPPDFTKQIELGTPAASFKHRYRDKVLEVVVFKR